MPPDHDPQRHEGDHLQVPVPLSFHDLVPSIIGPAWGPFKPFRP
jgi:hypothetical protein